MDFLNDLTGSTAGFQLLAVLVAWVLVQVIKPIVPNSKYVPLLASVIGIIEGCVLAYFTSNSILVFALIGLFSGFSATGLNETFTKSFIQALSTVSSKLASYFNSTTTEESETDTTEATTTSTTTTK